MGTEANAVDMIPVSVLFARSDTIYASLGCDVWDLSRDARLFAGSNPVIAHPPCRAWGQLRHLAKPRSGERALALIALDWVRRNGGVLEHPLRSSLFSRVIGRPTPKCPDDWGGWTLPFDQFWGGHRAQKATRLYICRVHPKSLPPMPFRLGEAPCMVAPWSNRGETARRRGVNPRPSISKAEREATPLEVAEWLVGVASAVRPAEEST